MVTTMASTTSTDDYSNLYRAEYRDLLRFAYLLVADLSLAEDLVADAFVRMFPKWRVGVVRNPSAYLRRSVVNAAYGRFRFHKRHPESSIVGESIAVEDSCAEEFANRDLVRRALTTLPPRQRAVIVLRYYLDMPEAMIARSLRVHVGTVKSQTAKAMATLRRTTEGPL